VHVEEARRRCATQGNARPAPGGGPRAARVAGQLLDGVGEQNAELGQARPASPTTPGSAECRLTTTGRAAGQRLQRREPEGLDRPGASTTSAADISRAIRSAPPTCPANTTGSPAAAAAATRAAARRRRRRAAPAARGAAARATASTARSGPLLARQPRGGDQQQLRSPASHGPGAAVGPEAVEVDAERHLAHDDAEPAELAAAHDVVQTTSSKPAASAAFERSAAASSGSRAGSHCRSSRSSRSWLTTSDGTPARAAQGRGAQRRAVVHLEPVGALGGTRRCTRRRR
jgi:hypothetical protein